MSKTNKFEVAEPETVEEVAEPETVEVKILTAASDPVILTVNGKAVFAAQVGTTSSINAIYVQSLKEAGVVFEVKKD